MRARIASFAGADFERIWSHISRLSAMSSEPEGKSSEVALSLCKTDELPRTSVLEIKVKGNLPIASSSWDVPHIQAPRPDIGRYL